MDINISKTKVIISGTIVPQHQHDSKMVLWFWTSITCHMVSVLTRKPSSQTHLKYQMITHLKLPSSQEAWQNHALIES